MAQRQQNLAQITALTIAVIMLSTKTCIITIENGFLKANCSSLGLQLIPTNLSSDIQSLDMSNNNLKEIRKLSLLRYQKLLNFTFNSISDQINVVAIDTDAFENIVSLQKLNLNYNDFGKTKLIFPPYLQRLQLSYTYQNSSNLDLRHLKSLSIVELSNNLLTEFPNFNEKAPLSEIDLSENPLSSISAEQLSPYCNLRILNFDFSENMKTYRNSCECARLKQWIALRRIESPKSQHFECKPDSVCKNPDILPELNKRHKICLQNDQNYFNRTENENVEYESTPSPSNILPITVIAIIIILGALAVYLFFLGVQKIQETMKTEREIEDFNFLP